MTTDSDRPRPAAAGADPLDLAGELRRRARRWWPSDGGHRGGLRPRPRHRLEDLAQRGGAGRARPSSWPSIDGAGRITHIWITTHADNWRTLVLRAYWDGADEPAVEVPYGDFFCSGWGRVRPGELAADRGEPARRVQLLLADAVPRPVRGSPSRTPPTSPVTVYYQVTYEIGGGPLRRRLPARAVAPQQPARVARPAHDPGGHRGTGALRRHLPRLGRQLQRLVGRGRDQVLPRRRHRLPDDLRHRHRGLLRRRLELRRARAGGTPSSPPRTSACRR